MVFYPKSPFWLKILVISVISCLKNRLFFKKTKNLFRFFSIYDFLILWSRILCPSSFNIFKFFFVGKSMSRCRALQSAFFQSSFIFIMYTDTYVTRHPFFGMVFESLNLWSPFSAKKVRIQKKGLCDALHPDMLFLTKIK